MDRAQQRMYPRPTGPTYMVPGMAMPQDMAQTLHGMPVPQVMMPAQYANFPGMMMPQGSMVPMPVSPYGTTSQLTQMLADSARQGRGSNIFFKTRLCNKWRSGSCPFGDKCTYAHGQHELRYIHPELVAQLEREQMSQEYAQQSAGGVGGGATPPPPPATGEAYASQQGPQRDDGSKEEDQRNKSQLYFKTRLCIRYMQTGYCNRGPACTFAHGYEDIRVLGQPEQRLQQPLQQSMAPRPSPENRSLGQVPVKVSPAVQQVRAGSAALGVGNADTIATQSAVRQAIQSVRNGDALRGGPYADSVEDMVDLQQ